MAAETTLGIDAGRGNAPRAAVAARTSPRRLLVDRLGRRLVSFGGMAVILTLAGILLFILAQTLPLAGAAKVATASVAPADPRAAAALLDEFGLSAATLGSDGALRVLRLDGAAGAAPPAVTWPLAALPLGEIAIAGDGRGFVAATADGGVALLPLAWENSFTGSRRGTTARPGEALVLALDTPPRALRAVSGAATADGAAAAGLTADGRLVVVRRALERNEISGETSARDERFEQVAPPRLARLALDAAARNLYGGADDGALYWWSIGSAGLGAPRVARGGAAVTALTLLVGERALVVGRSDGALEIYFPLRDARAGDRLAAVRSFAPLPAPVIAISASPRDKRFLALATDGTAVLDHSTSHRELWRGRSPAADARSIAFAPKADGAVVLGASSVAHVLIDNPHPEISFEALLGKVWYEGYDGPRYVWQSSGATDDTEPKLSLVPLLAGTLKGTIYSLILALPLGVLGAMFTSQLLHPALGRIVKPTIELMAALPSVVLGFLAGLWLAPRLEAAFATLALMALFIPLGAFAAFGACRLVPLHWRGRFPMGYEVIPTVGVLALALGASVSAAPWVEHTLLGARFPDWLRAATGLTYDQRNAVVVGIAMGFAVIPIIFSVAEEAFSNVPRHLVAGSLALGATRWQTVVRVVLPSASPGIFSAVMIGFGRAVGETMIVLMATGNTPLIDWSPFNGFRTLAANIAVEIPEAPRGGTLFRTLFLAALLLFVLTFVINTAADLVRQRLRRRYASS